MGILKSKKKQYNKFTLRVRFNFAKGVKGTNAEKKATVERWIRVAERCYRDKPNLKISPEWRWSVASVPANLSFKNSRELRKFMDDSFDNLVGDKRTKGCLQVLIVDSVIKTKENKSLNGSAFFPHCVTPFARKHGIIMDYGALKSTFAHELGHVFSLKHTFGSYVGTKRNCNRGYPKGKNGQGGTRSGNRINLMDYDRKDSNTVFLNDCQCKRAAKQRRLYMTRDGDTNYRKLRGLR